MPTPSVAMDATHDASPTVVSAAAVPAPDAPAAEATSLGHADPIALNVHTTSVSSEDSFGWDLLQETGNVLAHFLLAAFQGVIGLIPLMLMWSVLCTVVALILLPCDIVLAFIHVSRQARQQGFLKTVMGLLFILVVAAIWPVVVCTFHLMAAFVLAFSEPFEYQPTDEWYSLTLGGLGSMFSFAMERMTDFLRLCWVSQVDFWLKWKMMVRAVTSFMVFFAHAVVTAVSSVLLAAIKLPVIVVLGATLPWFMCANLSCCFAGNNTLIQVALWLVTVPLIAPVVLVISALSCALFVIAYTVGSSFLVVMSILGGGLYVADCQFKKMSWRTTRLAMAFVITEFDKDTSELLSHIIMEEAEIGRLLPVLSDPYPEFTADDSGNGLNSQVNSLDESCEAFLESCKVQSKELMATNWLEATDFLNAEPFLFMGVPGHVLLTYMQQSPYEAVTLKPGYTVRLREDVLGTSWVDSMRQELLKLQVQVFETCVEEEEWRYLKAWVLLSGDEERMPALGLTVPSNIERAAQLHRVAGAVNSMAISITRMGWFQAHFQKRVMDAAMEGGAIDAAVAADTESKKQQKLSLAPATAKSDASALADTAPRCSTPGGISAVHASEACSRNSGGSAALQSGSVHSEASAANHLATSSEAGSVAVDLPGPVAGIDSPQQTVGGQESGSPSAGQAIPDHVTIEMAGGLPLSGSRD